MSRTALTEGQHERLVRLLDQLIEPDSPAGRIADRLGDLLFDCGAGSWVEVIPKPPHANDDATSSLLSEFDVPTVADLLDHILACRVEMNDWQGKLVRDLFAFRRLTPRQCESVRQIALKAKWNDRLPSQGTAAPRPASRERDEASGWQGASARRRAAR